MKWKTQIYIIKMDKSSSVDNLLVHIQNVKCKYLANSGANVRSSGNLYRNWSVRFQGLTSLAIICSPWREKDWADSAPNTLLQKQPAWQKACRNKYICRLPLVHPAGSCGWWPW